jgi:hypothetical protein
LKIEWRKQGLDFYPGRMPKNDANSGPDDWLRLSRKSVSREKQREEEERKMNQINIFLSSGLIAIYYLQKNYTTLFSGIIIL